MNHKAFTLIPNYKIMNQATPTKQQATGIKDNSLIKPPNTSRTLHPVSCIMKYEEGDFDVGCRVVVVQH